MASSQTHDYIVVGGGSAGCVVTRRLVDAGHRVLLLEAGPTDKTLFVQIPATFVRVIGTERTWDYLTTPQEHCAGRKVYIPQGRTLGGGSAVNAMIYIRGNARDYDRWAAMGCEGWGWNEVLPWFKYAEGNQRLSGAYHGTDGLLKVSDTRFHHPLGYAFVKGAQECGLPYNDDFNGAGQIGAGFYQTTTFEGQRASTAFSYLDAIRQHPDVTIHTGAFATRVVIENHRATAVVWRDAGGRQITSTASREIVVTAGALSTPKLLMLSGIGPGAQLQAQGITVLKDVPAVGQNLQDHLEVAVYARTRQPVSLFGNDRGLTALRHGAQWMLTRSGLLTNNVVECGGFVDTLGRGEPDIQFHVLPVLVGDVDRKPIDGHGLTINPCFLQPESRGQLRLVSANPDAALEIDANVLSAHSDVDTLVRGVKLARRILRSPSMQKVVAQELSPSADENVSDEVLEAHVRKIAKTVYHPAGTCRMGAENDATAVVDAKLRVKGIDGLRVCDSSVLPTLPSGNTNAPVVMIAERCAHFMLA
jgi:choline dehydrogenase-like flavoprotein